MARENTVILHGQIYNDPKIFLNKAGEKVQASFNLKVMRRPFLNGQGQPVMGKLRVDFPLILTRNIDLINQCVNFCKGDMIDVKGVLTTRNVRREYVCPNGHQINTIGTHVYVTPIYLCRREPKQNEENGFALLRERSEISNICMIIGSLCQDPSFYEHPDGEGSCMTQYQIAAARRYHIQDGHDDERTDFLWVKTINKQARDDMEHLHTGSSVYINGALQSREIVKKITCPVCGEVFEKKDLAYEIFPYSVEYLMNCTFTPKDADDSAEQKSE